MLIIAVPVTWFTRLTFSSRAVAGAVQPGAKTVAVGPETSALLQVFAIRTVTSSV